MLVESLPWDWTVEASDCSLPVMCLRRTSIMSEHLSKPMIFRRRKVISPGKCLVLMTCPTGESNRESFSSSCRVLCTTHTSSSLAQPNQQLIACQVHRSQSSPRAECDEPGAGPVSGAGGGRSRECNVDRRRRWYGATVEGCKPRLLTSSQPATTF